MPPGYADPCTLWSDKQRASTRKSADRVKFQLGLFSRTNPSRDSRHAQIENKAGIHGKNRIFIIPASLGIVSHRGKVRLRMNSRNGPRSAAVMRECEVGTILIGMLVVAAGNRAVQSIAKDDRENSSRVRAMCNGRLRDQPSLSPIRRVENSRRRTSRSEPNVGITRGNHPHPNRRRGGFRIFERIVPCSSSVFARALRRQKGNTRCAGGESAFARDRCRKIRWRNRAPSLAIVSNQQLELQRTRLTPARIAQNDAVRGIPERHRVKKYLGIAVGELQGPVLAGISSVINTRLLSRPSGHQKSFVRGERNHSAKIESLGTWNDRGRPMSARIRGAEICAVRARSQPKAL